MIRSNLINKTFTLAFMMFVAPQMNASAPLWTFTPLTATTLAVPANGSATVQYRVTNQSRKTHSLKMKTISGITQVTSPGNCPNPFILAYQQSCILNLTISGSALNNSIITGGPQVCQDGNPNQCYQPSRANSLNLTLSSSGTTISITAPIQSNRVVPVPPGGTLSLEITNNPSGFSATNVTVTNKATCPNLNVDDSNCTSVTSGASCLLQLSSNTPYTPCTITIGGSNTQNSPTALIAFSYLGGLVFESNGIAGKVVIDVAQEFSSQWTSSNSFTGATDSSNGQGNTLSIIGDTACMSDPVNCAAQRCENIGASWYLPATGEINDILNALCSNGVIPCNFGGFSASSYWSSVQASNTTARSVTFPVLSFLVNLKSSSQRVRCALAF